VVTPSRGDITPATKTGPTRDGSVRMAKL